jgi:hypothetical protein
MRSLQFVLLAAISLVVAPRLQADVQGSFIGYASRRGLAFNPTSNYLFVSDLVFNGNVDAVGFGVPGPVLYWNFQPLRVPLDDLDVSADGSFLLVAQNDPKAAQGIFYRVETGSENISQVPYARTSAEAGPLDVAIASNNLAFFTT